MGLFGPMLFVQWGIIMLRLQDICVVKPVNGSQWRVLGDYWAFEVEYRSVNGLAAVLTDQMPGAELLVGASPSTVTLALTVISASGNKIIYGINTDVQNGGVAIVPVGADSFVFDLRIHAWLVDSIGHKTTYVIASVIAIDARNVDVSELPSPNAIVAVAGPTGPVGPSPDLTLLNAATTASATSATNAHTSEVNAAGLATSALNSATAAAGSAGTATTQAGIATAAAQTATDKAGIATDQAGIATAQAGASATSAAASEASRVAAGNLLLSFRSVFLGSFASDAAADAFATAQNVTKTAGISYENTTNLIVRVWSGTAWTDQDADAKTQTANAAASAVTAGTAATAAGVLAGNAATSETNALASKNAAAGSATAAGTAATNSQTYMNSASASALLASGYVASAAVSAANANTVSGLSNLNSAARAIALATDVTGVFVYDTAKDSDGGAWRSKVASASWMNETLNTATRGTRAQFPSRVLIVTRAASLTIYDLDDPTCPMWRVFSGFTYTTGFNNPVAVNGFICFGFSTYIQRLDFVSDSMDFLGNANHFSIPGNIVTGKGATYTVTPGPAFASATVSDIAATVLPLTPPNPLRCGLPNPTLAISSSAGLIVILRADSVAIALIVACTKVAFDSSGRLWSQLSTNAYVYVWMPSAYLQSISSSNVLAYFSPAQLNEPTAAISGLKGTAEGCIVTSSFGVTRVKLDQTSPANSLIEYKTAAYETGWMPGGGFATTVPIRLALAESSADVSNLVAAVVLNDTFATDPGSYTIGGTSAGRWKPQLYRFRQSDGVLVFGRAAGLSEGDVDGGR